MSPDFSLLYTIYQEFLLSTAVTTNSRLVSPGSMFFALKGENFDGNQFAAEALMKGASRVVVDDPAVVRDSRYLLVESVLDTLQQLAIQHRDQFTLPVIAITGSNGKTTTKELIYAILSAQSPTIATQGNLNNHIGVPLTLLRLATSTRFLVVEMGANHKGEITALCNLAKPTHGIITNIGPAHLEGFGSQEGVRQAKSELYHYLNSRDQSTIIWNADDPVIRNLVKPMRTRKISYGRTRKADVRGSVASSGLFLAVRWQAPDRLSEFQTNLVGEYNFPNVMAAIATGQLLTMETGTIIQAIQAYTPANNRSQFSDTGRNQVVIDCYNANPASMQAAIDHFIRISGPESLLILGDMFELGSYSSDEHWQLLNLIKKTGCQCITVGQAFFNLADEFSLTAFRDVEELTQWLADHPVKGRQILLKGSHGVKLEKAIPFL